MLEQTIDLSNLTTKLAAFMTGENSKRVHLHLRLFKKLLLKYAILRSESKTILDDIQVLLTDDKWLKLEVLAEQLNKDDDVLFRRCLFHFAKCMESSVIRPSAVTVFDTDIDLLHWYRINYQFGCELNTAITCWDETSTLANSTKRAIAQKALHCLNVLCQKESSVLDTLLDDGLLWFESVTRYKAVFKQYPIQDKNKVLESALLAVLRVYRPLEFETVSITINHKTIDVTDIAEIEPSIVGQLNQLDKLYISDTASEISKIGVQNSSATILPKGVVIMSRDAGVGKSAITTEKMAVSQHFMAWQCGEQMDNYFLYYWLQHNKRSFENIAIGSTIVTIGLPYFKKLLIGAPISLIEQQAISQKLIKIETYLFSLKSDLEKLKSMKIGLMQDLLTGKKTVSLSNSEVDCV